MNKNADSPNPPNLASVQVNPQLLEAYPSLKHGHWVNHAAISPWPRASQAAVQAFALENAESGASDYSSWLRRETALRERVARLLNAPAGEDIAFTANTSSGINLVALGLDWRHGDNLVLPSGEFPSNALPWLRLAETGVEVREVEIHVAADPEAALLERMDARTRLLAVSAVHWLDGFRLDLPALGEVCRARDILFMVDGIQQFGAVPLDLQASRIDCFAAGSHKWQMGPEGIGVFYCTPAWRERLDLRQPGWHSLEHPYRFSATGIDALAPSARRFEAGSPNMLGQAALFAALGELEGHGIAEVGRRVLENTRAIIAAADSWEAVSVASSREPHRQSGIVTLALDGPALGQPPGMRPSGGPRATRLHKLLERRGVHCALRGAGLRLSPHFYQHGAPLAEMLAIVGEELVKLKA